jgi:hypothetical protein
MPDITLCSNDTCERRKECNRFTSKPDSHWQSYIRFEEKDCEYFITNAKQL